MPHRLLALPLGLGLWICASLAAVNGCRTPEGPRAGAQVVQPVSLPQDPLETIARYEDARRDGDGLLEALVGRGDEPTRARAAVALGRLPREEHGTAVTAALVGALEDPAPRVRAAAAFALGMRADPSSAAALAARASDPDPLVRARVVEAASRIDEPLARARVLAALDDVDAGVRTEAAVGPSRFAAPAPDAHAVDERLIAYMGRVGTAGGGESDDRARRGALFSLARRRSEAARATFVRFATSRDEHARIYCVQGLGSLPTDDDTSRVLVRALKDADARVACEAAAALGKQPHPAAVDGLIEATTHPSAHVRRCAFEALASYGDQKSAVLPSIERARVDSSASVRAAAIATGARLTGAEAAPKLAFSASDKDAVVRAGTAAAAAFLPAELAVPLLDKLSRDSHLRVAGIAVEGLGAYSTPASRARLLEILRGPDNGLRLAAVGSLAKTPVASDASALLECLRTSRGEISTELAYTIVDLAPKYGPDGRELVRAGSSHADEFVRRRARAVAAEAYPDLRAPAGEIDTPRLAAVPIPGKDAPLWKRNPRVEMRTTRGVLVFELFPDEAPGHVFNFLALIDVQHYDGLDFHRVVPDFVVQGGDHRGDGNGGVTWRGELLRAEFTPRKFVRGSLGMPRNDDPDSGGSQFFVTHRETPHLDGRYTIFGELREGFDVLDAIEVGDKILSIRLLGVP